MRASTLRTISGATIAAFAVAVTLVGCVPEPVDSATASPLPSASAPSGEATSPAEPSASASPTPSRTPDVVVNVITADATDSELEATAMVSDVIEDGGECELIATSGSTTRRATADARSGPTSTFCGLMTIPLDELRAGSWRIVIQYESDAHFGVSEPTDIEIS